MPIAKSISGTGSVALVITLVATCLPPLSSPLHAGQLACTRSGNLGDLGLVPYFEVDLGDPASSNSFFGIRRAFYFNHTPRIYRVTLWTDFGIPTVSFDVVVRQTKELALSLLLGNGALPNSDADRASVAAVPGCADFPPPAAITSKILGSTQRRHLGLADFGRCHALNHGDGVSRGSITIQPVQECSPTTLGGAASPAEPPYAADNLVLEEFLVDYFLVDQTSFVATSLTGVMPRVFVGADSFFEKFGPPFAHFQTLPDAWQTRFFSGLDFDGGTDLIVWRDSGVDPGPDVACGGFPPGLPMSAAFAAYSESGATTISGTTSAFPLTTQRVPVDDVLGSGPALSAGEIYLDLFVAGPIPSQAHVVSAMTASDRYGIALEGTPAFFCQ